VDEEGDSFFVYVQQIVVVEEKCMDPVGSLLLDQIWCKHRGALNTTFCDRWLNN